MPAIAIPVPISATPHELFAKLQEWSPWCSPSPLYDRYRESEFVDERGFRYVTYTSLLLVVEFRRDAERNQAYLTVRPHAASRIGLLFIGLIPLGLSVWLFATARPGDSLLRSQVLLWGCPLLAGFALVTGNRAEVRRFARSTQEAIDREWPSGLPAPTP